MLIALTLKEGLPVTGLQCGARRPDDRKVARILKAQVHSELLVGQDVLV
jgi:hypothetical protein